MMNRAERRAAERAERARKRYLLNKGFHARTPEESAELGRMVAAWEARQVPIAFQEDQNKGEHDG